MKERTLIKTKEEKSGKPTTSIKTFTLENHTRQLGEVYDSDPQEFQLAAVLPQSLMWNSTVWLLLL